jgi:hypothetical protein
MCFAIAAAAPVSGDAPFEGSGPTPVAAGCGADAVTGGVGTVAARGCPFCALAPAVASLSAAEPFGEAEPFPARGR